MEYLSGRTTTFGLILMLAAGLASSPRCQAAAGESPTPKKGTALRLTYRLEAETKLATAWGLVPVGNSRATQEYEFLLGVIPRGDGRFDLELRPVSGNYYEEENGGKVTYFLPREWKGRVVARATWSAERGRLEGIRTEVPDDLPALRPRFIQQVLASLLPGVDRREESPPAEGSEEETWSLVYDYQPDPPELDRGGGVFEQRGDVRVLMDEKEVGSGTTTVTGRLDPDTGLCRERREQVQLDISIGSNTGSMTWSVSSHLAPAEGAVTSRP